MKLLTVAGYTKKKTLQKEVREKLVVGSALFTDALKSYEGLSECHTNGLENFWALLKRGLNGTYVSVEPYHLFRCLDEAAYHFNNREFTDGERFDMAVRQIVVSV